jgi:Vitamin K-dependent gamma-carboxylase
MKLATRALAAWSRWLFSEADLRPLALFRMGWAVAMFEATRHEGGLYTLYSSAQYHVPLARWAAPLTLLAFQRLIVAGKLGCALTLLGLSPRLGIVLVMSALGYLFASDLLLFRNHVYLGLLLGMLLWSSPSGHALSLDALWRHWRGQPFARVGSWSAAQLIKAQVVIVYAYSVVAKSCSAFLDGFTLQVELPFALHSCPLSGWLYDAQGNLSPAVASLLQSDRALAVCACAVWCAEAFLACGLPSRRLRGYAVAVGLALHGSIFLLMNISVFGLLMVATYPLFFARTAQPASGLARPRFTSAAESR